MKPYEIPLSTIYEDGGGPRVIFDARGRVSIVDRTGETPHDLIRLYTGEIQELINVLTAYLNANNDGTVSAMGRDYDQFRTDQEDSE